MSKIITLNQNTKSIMYLCKRDKRLAKVISMVGPITYKPYEDGYKFIIDTIIGQMLSNTVADTISNRLEKLCHDDVVPRTVNNLSFEQIRSIGLSKAKTQYIINFTEKVIKGSFDFSVLTNLTDSDVLKLLTSIKGLGPWSAKMYLIFVLNRQDILPYEDGAFLQSYSWLYKTNDLKPSVIKSKCMKWRPYSSIAARYLYKALDYGITKAEFHLFK